jgi:hypothetical protein
MDSAWPRASKKKAEETYDKAKRGAPAARDAATERCAPVPDARRWNSRGWHKRVEASWAQILRYDGRLVTLRVPLQRIGEAIGVTRIRVACEDQKRIVEVKLASRQQPNIERTPNGFVLTFEAKNAQPEEELLLTYRTDSFTPSFHRGDLGRW